MAKRILITGGAGFIGSHLADSFLTDGHSVTVLDNLSPQVHTRGERPSYLNSEVELIQADIRNKDAVRQAISKTDIVYH
ncbi:MAG TPA: SDR family NAD(P)-dependent oxidoreductase, partial [Acidobacteriota bacterium]|nr:SDR family NAD(P)-dependent oxidoreductase [Acidobacteriota bacterium]